MKKHFIICLLAITVMATGCQKEAKAPDIPESVPTQEETVKPAEIEAEVAGEMVEAPEEIAEVEEPEGEMLVLTNSSGEKYVCLLTDEGVTVTFEDEESYENTIDAGTYGRVRKVMDIVLNEHDEFVQMAKAAGIPDSQIDPEGWVGEMLYSMARGKEMLNNDMTYSRYGFETLLELESIVNGY